MSPRLYCWFSCWDVSEVSPLQPRQACRVDQQHSRETLQRHFELIYLVAFTQWWCASHDCNGIIQFSSSHLRLISCMGLTIDLVQFLSGREKYLQLFDYDYHFMMLSIIWKIFNSLSFLVIIINPMQFSWKGHSCTWQMYIDNKFLIE